MTTRRVQGRMFNDYVKTVEVFDVDKMIQDVFIPDYFLECYDFIEESAGWVFVIIEADDHTWVAIQSAMADDPDTLVVNKDGEVWMSAQGFASPDLEAGTYYMGDEAQHVANLPAYKSDSQWLWNSRFPSPRFHIVPMSTKTHAKIVGRILNDCE